jgi:uncharacterized protein YerC
MYPYMSKSNISTTIEIPDEIIRDLLTESELRMVKQRLFVLKLIKRGLSIRAVAQRAKVGTDTVVRILRKLELSPNLKKYFEEKEDKKLPSKWIFGGVEFEKEEH